MVADWLFRSSKRYWGRGGEATGESAMWDGEVDDDLAAWSSLRESGPAQQVARGDRNTAKLYESSDQEIQ
jgi:hypothetical protein